MSVIWVTTSLVLLLIAVIIMAVTFGFLTWLGDQVRARKASLQGIRWLSAGLVVAVVANTATNGDSYELILPATLALVALVIVEYYMLGIESEIKQKEETNSD